MWYKNERVEIHAISSWLPEPLPETGVLANHSSDFGPAKRTQSTPDQERILALLAAGPFH